MIKYVSTITAISLLASAVSPTLLVCMQEYKEEKLATIIKNRKHYEDLKCYTPIDPKSFVSTSEENIKNLQSLKTHCYIIQRACEFLGVSSALWSSYLAKKILTEEKEQRDKYSLDIAVGIMTTLAGFIGSVICRKFKSVTNNNIIEQEQDVTKAKSYGFTDEKNELQFADGFYLQKAFTKNVILTIQQYTDIFGIPEISHNKIGTKFTQDMNLARVIVGKINNGLAKIIKKQDLDDEEVIILSKVFFARETILKHIELLSLKVEEENKKAFLIISSIDPQRMTQQNYEKLLQNFAQKYVKEKNENGEDEFGKKVEETNENNETEQQKDDTKEFKEKLNELTRQTKELVRQFSLQDEKQEKSVITQLILDLEDLKISFNENEEFLKNIQKNIDLIQEHLSKFIPTKEELEEFQKKQKEQKLIEEKQQRVTNIKIIEKFEGNLTKLQGVFAFFSLESEYKNVQIDRQKLKKLSRSKVTNDYSDEYIKSELNLIIPFQKLIIEKIGKALANTTEKKQREEITGYIEKFQDTLDSDTQEHKTVVLFLQKARTSSLRKVNN